MSQLVERFTAAIQALVGDGPIKVRLGLAYTRYLEDLQQVDLPIAGKRELGELHSAMHRASAVGKIDSVTASVQKMSSMEAWQYAQTVVKLYSEVLLMEHSARTQTERQLKGADEAPPRILVTGSG